MNSPESCEFLLTEVQQALQEACGKREPGGGREGYSWHRGRDGIRLSLWFRRLHILLAHSRNSSFR